MSEPAMSTPPVAPERVKALLLGIANERMFLRANGWMAADVRVKEDVAATLRRVASEYEELVKERESSKRLAAWCVEYRDRLDNLIGTGGGAERKMIVSVGLGLRDRVAMVCAKPWPRGVFVQGGEQCQLLKGEAPAFVEAFPPDDERRYRGEGATLAEAEEACWQRYTAVRPPVPERSEADNG